MTLTAAQQEFALSIVAAWLGAGGGMSEDGSPVPTGPEAAYNGRGPQLIQNWETNSGVVAPAILLEGGSYDWPYYASNNPAVREQLARRGIQAQAYSSYALLLFPL